jgi:hypothetical protein
MQMQQTKRFQRAIKREERRDAHRTACQARSKLMEKIHGRDEVIDLTAADEDDRPSEIDVLNAQLWATA